jgi:CarboxypepD_reg-like domain
MRNPFLLLLLMISFQAISQNFTLSGKITDKSNGETIVGCNITLQNNNKKYATTTNEYGFYSITDPQGIYNFITGYAGFNNHSIEINLDKNTSLNIKLVNDNQLDEVVVVSTRENKVRSTAIGVEKLNMKEIEKLPVLFGEKDLLKTIQLTRSKI